MTKKLKQFNLYKFDVGNFCSTQTETIEQAIENIINRPKETPRIRSGNR